MLKWFPTVVGKIIDLKFQKKNVSFNIFKRSSENAIFNICKNFKTKNNNLRYYVSDAQGNILSISKKLETLIDKVKWNKYKIVN